MQASDRALAQIRIELKAKDLYRWILRMRTLLIKYPNTKIRYLVSVADDDNHDEWADEPLVSGNQEQP